ncbi:hypothetical protein V2A60_009527 [Cordyceps javanica]
MSTLDLQKAATALANEQCGDRSWSAKGDGVLPPSNSTGVTAPRYFVRFEMDRTQTKLPCSVTVVIDCAMIGSMAVMAHPAEGIMKGGFVIGSSVH